MKKILFILTFVVSFIVFGASNTYASSGQYISLEGPSEVTAGQTYSYIYYMRSVAGSGPFTLTADSNYPLATFDYDSSIFDMVGSGTSNYGITITSNNLVMVNNNITVPVGAPLIQLDLKVKSNVTSQTTKIGRRFSDAPSDANSMLTDIKVVGKSTDSSETNAITTNKANDESTAINNTLMTVAIVTLGVVAVVISITLAVVIRKK